MIILLDVDKTLINEQYQYTDPSIESVVRAVQENGHRIGLTSDTPIARLKEIAQELHLTGPILAERGAVILWPDGEIIPTGSAPQELFASIRKDFIHAFSEKIDVICCDPTLVRKTHRYRTKKSESVILINAKRQYSFHASAHTLTEDAFLSNPELLQEIERYLRAHVASMDFAFDWDVNPEYSLVILHGINTTKAFGTHALIQQQKTYKERIVLVGDGANDFTGIQEVEHWAVGNANDTFKKNCTRIANGTYTKGVSELLSSLI